MCVHDDPLVRARLVAGDTQRTRRGAVGRLGVVDGNVHEFVVWRPQDVWRCRAAVDHRRRARFRRGQKTMRSSAVGIQKRSHDLAAVVDPPQIGVIGITRVIDPSKGAPGIQESMVCDGKSTTRTGDRDLDVSNDLAATVDPAQDGPASDGRSPRRASKARVIDLY